MPFRAGDFDTYFGSPRKISGAAALKLPKGITGAYESTAFEPTRVLPGMTFDDVIIAVARACQITRRKLLARSLKPDPAKDLAAYLLRRDMSAKNRQVKELLNYSSEAAAIDGSVRIMRRYKNDAVLADKMARARAFYPRMAQQAMRDEAAKGA